MRFGDLRKTLTSNTSTEAFIHIHTQIRNRRSSRKQQKCHNGAQVLLVSERHLCLYHRVVRAACTPSKSRNREEVWTSVPSLYNCTTDVFWSSALSLCASHDKEQLSAQRIYYGIGHKKKEQDSQTILLLLLSPLLLLLKPVGSYCNKRIGKTTSPYFSLSGDWGGTSL